MLGRREKNISIGDLWIENRIEKGSFWHKMRMFVDNHLSDETFEKLFSNYGRPSIPPVYTFVAILIQFETGQSDKDMEGSTAFDARYKYAMSAPQDFSGIDSVTLCEHRNRFFENEVGKKIFVEFLKVVAEEESFKYENLNVIDSFMVVGSSAKQSTYQMIYGAIKNTLRIIKMQEIKLPNYKMIRSDYNENLKKPSIDWSDKKEKAKLIDELVRDGLSIIKALETSEEFNKNNEIERAYKLLKKVTTQDVEKDEFGKYQVTKGTAKDRTISIIEPEMRHGHKTTSVKNDGYKCEIITGGKKGKFVIANRVFPANKPDGTYMDELIDEVDNYEIDLTIDTLYGDTAYCDFNTIEEYEEKNSMEFVVKAQPIKSNKGFYTKDDFEINLDKMEVTCPSGNVEKIKKQGKITIIFSKKRCNCCSKKELCTNSKSGRSITINKYEKRLKEQREKQLTAEFKKDYNQRSNGERTICFLTSKGGRKARYVGIKKVQEQQYLVSLLNNIKQFAGELFKKTSSKCGWSMPKIYSYQINK